MIRKNDDSKRLLEVVCIEDLVPKDHVLRKIDKCIDFSFIRELTRPYYSLDNGRPGVDPIILFKMIFLKYLFGISSERQLVKDIQVNVAYRWFLGFSLTDDIPSPSTISMNRIRRFNGTSVVQEVFSTIASQAMQYGLVVQENFHTDADKEKLIVQQVAKCIKDYSK